MEPLHSGFSLFWAQDLIFGSAQEPKLLTCELLSTLRGYWGHLIDGPAGSIHGLYYGPCFGLYMGAVSPGRTRNFDRNTCACQYHAPRVVIGSSGKVPN